jgi:hypothetical protein
MLAPYFLRTSATLEDEGSMLTIFPSNALLVDEMKKKRLFCTIVSRDEVRASSTEEDDALLLYVLTQGGTAEDQSNWYYDFLFSFGFLWHNITHIALKMNPLPTWFDWYHCVHKIAYVPKYQPQTNKYCY